MQYAPAEMGLMAIEDILEGPERMHRDVLSASPELTRCARTTTTRSRQARSRPVPAGAPQEAAAQGQGPAAPIGPVARAKTMALSAIRQALPVRDLSQSTPRGQRPPRRPQVVAAGSQFDSALVSSADGTSASWYKRDPEMSRDLMSRSVALHVRLAKEWPELAQTYKDALPELASPKTWAATFEDSLDDGRSPAAKPQGSAQ